MSCIACGQTLTKFEYQSRSADEAHTTSYKCSKCPLDIDKFYNAIPSVHVHLPRAERYQRKRLELGSPSVMRRTLISIRTKNMNVFKNVKYSKSMCCNGVDSNSNLFKVYTKGIWSGTAMSRKGEIKLTPNASMEYVDMFDHAIQQDYTYVDFEYARYEDMDIIKQDHHVIMIKIVEDASDTDILHIIDKAYMLGFCPDSLAEFSDAVFLGSVSNLTARAYDASEVDDSEYYFSTKPDGERMWLTKCGSVWFYCRRLLGFKIVSFVMEDYIDQFSGTRPAPILDIETMVSHDDILIDILVGYSSVQSPYDRTIPWINATFSVMLNNHRVLRSIHVRPYFPSLIEASKYSNTVPYPVDGLVAISRSGTDMKKMKSVKSMELQLSEDGVLQSKSGTKLMKIRGDHRLEQGCIVEVRFASDNGKLDIKEYFRRFDKSAANDDSAILSIMESCFKPTQEQLVRNSIWRWSNRLRSAIYSRAQVVSDERPIILDIGSGSGQSSESFSELGDCSIVLIEPDESKCKSLCRRLKTRDYHKNPRSLIQVVSQLRRGTRKYHILNCTLQELLDDKPSIENIKHLVSRAVACFSCHFIVKEIDRVIGLGISFIGCYYSYENVDVGNHIIKCGNISMTRIGYSEARVKWGSDKPYTEPVVNEEDLPFSTSSIRAVDMVDYTEGSSEGAAYDACSAVRVLISP